MLATISWIIGIICMATWLYMGLHTKNFKLFCLCAAVGIGFLFYWWAFAVTAIILVCVFFISEFVYQKFSAIL